MSVFTRLAGRVRSLFATDNDIGKAFGVDLILSPEMNTAIGQWDSISTGNPSWKRMDDNVETLNMAKFIADTRAKLTALDIGIAISGPNGTVSRRADYLQELADDLLHRLPDGLTNADRLGGMVIKFNGVSWDLIPPGDFGITALDSNGNINGAIFAAHTSQGKDHYTRLEYHRFEDVMQDGGQEGEPTTAMRLYHVSNKAFKSTTVAGRTSDLGKEVELSEVGIWADMAQDVYISDLDVPLFAYYRVPGANTIDPSSPLGLSVFANAITELRALDIAVSRKDLEIEDSKHITFVGQQVIKNAQHKALKLPRFVMGLGMGVDDGDMAAVHEHVPTIQTEARLRDINFDLSMIGVKCGFSEGVFVMDGQRGMVTATQVEADDRDTIQTIKTDRDALESAITQAIAGADALATLMGLAPPGEYEINFNFGDITYSYEEDKASWRGYVLQGWVPKWLYFVKFEGYSEEDARKLVAEAESENVSALQLFSGGD